MATIVCQGLQSYLESPLEPRTLRLKLASSILPHFPQPFEPFPSAEKCQYHHSNGGDRADHASSDDNNNTNSNVYNGGWSFLQNLPSSKHEKDAATYVHPLVKRSSSALSAKSLELCTENLGNETGTCDINDHNCNGILSNTWMEDVERTEVKKTTMRSPSSGGGCGSGKRSFPPPLTTMSGKDSLQVRPHREDGRLIIKAVKGPSRLRSCFQAERSDGRLRLRLLEDYNAPPATFDSEEKNVESEKDGCENDTKDENDIEEEEEEEEEDEEEGEGEEVGEKEKGKMGTREKYERGGSRNRRRCKEVVKCNMRRKLVC